MNRIEKLKCIFKIYGEEVNKYSFVCKENCASCCTSNVIITTLECENILTHDIDKEDLKNKHGIRRFHPKLTTNMIADYMKDGRDLPEEDIDSSWGECVFLKDNLCSIYNVRPFGCRCMVSSVNCAETGYAQTQPYILTLNNVILQFIEHLDHDGFTGNILDMVILEKEDNENFVNNRKMSILMVPPEHRSEIRVVVEKLSTLFQE